MTRDRLWRRLYQVLMVCFLLAAALNMLHVRAGFLTSYLGDLTVPALLYVVARKPRATGASSQWPFMRWLGRSPERAALTFFLASAATEVSQIYWPRGIFSGRFDPWDIAAYGVGLLGCYLLDRRHVAPATSPPGGA